jgi:hypothetical protein
MFFDADLLDCDVGIVRRQRDLLDRSYRES